MEHQNIYFEPQQAQRPSSQEPSQLTVQYLGLILFLKPLLAVICQQIMVFQAILSSDLVEFHLGNQGYHVAALELEVVDLENLGETTEQMKVPSSAHYWLQVGWQM
jgi:hypothetical protein